MSLPPLPPGFEMQGDAPPLPPGFQLVKPMPPRKKKAPAASNYNPTGIAALNPITRQIGGFLDGLQHHGMNAVHGAAQGVEHMANAAADANDPMRGAINRTMLADDAGLQRREDAYQARTAPTNGVPNVGSYLGATVGEIAPWMTGVGEARALGMLPRIGGTGAKVLAKKVGLLSTEGAAMGASTPVTDGGDYGSEKAMQTGVGAVTAPLLAGLGTTAFRAYDRVVRPERTAARIVRDLVGNPEKLDRPPNGDGLVPTVAEMDPSPQSIKLDRKLRNHPVRGIPFAVQDNANDAARHAMLTDMAGTPEKLQAAYDARTAATKPYYAQLPGTGVDPAPVLKALDDLHNSGMGVHSKVKTAVASLRGEIESRTAADGTIDADILNGLHENAGSHLGPMSTAKERKALGPIKAAIAETLDARLPGFRDNLAAYAEHSAPINAMGAARRITDDVSYSGRNSSGNPSATLAVVRKELKADDRARFPMAPKDRAKLQAVFDSLTARSATNSKISAAGPSTAADIASGGMSPHIMGKVRGGAAAIAGGLLSHFAGVPGVGEALGMYAGYGASNAVAHVNNRVGLLVAERMANAEKAAEAIRSLHHSKRGLLHRVGNVPAYLLPYAN